MGDFNKQKKINKQLPLTGEAVAPKTFSSVDEAKNYYYTAKELAVFDKWCDKIQWAVINDSFGDAAWLKVTMDFDAKGKADSWHNELDTLSGELPAHMNALSNKDKYCITVEQSDDHLY